MRAVAIISESLVNKPAKSRKKRADGKAGAQTGAKGEHASAEQLLKQDHRHLEGELDRYDASMSAEQRAAQVRQALAALNLHTTLKEELLYPMCRAQGLATLVDVAQVQHDLGKLLAADLMEQPPDSPFFEAKFQVLRDGVKRHIAMEEQAGTGLLAKAQECGIDFDELGERIRMRRAELERARDFILSPIVTLKILDAQHHQTEDAMNRQSNERERDAQGRFTEQDDRSRGSRYESRQGGYDDERYSRRDDERRDRDGDWRASSRGGRDWDEERSYGRRYGSDDDRDDQGRFASSRSNDRDRDDRGQFTSSRSNDRDEQGRYSSRSGNDREDQGRYSSRSSNDRDDQGRYSSRSNNDRDEQGRFTSSRSDDRDDRDRYASSGTGRGWFGDSEGHSRASERGWEERGGERGRGSQGSYVRHSGRYEDEGNRGRERSGSSRGGHGGWFGDSEGHAEAARRRWE